MFIEKFLNNMGYRSGYINACQDFYFGVLNEQKAKAFIDGSLDDIREDTKEEIEIAIQNTLYNEDYLKEIYEEDDDENCFCKYCEDEEDEEDDDEGCEYRGSEYTLRKEGPKVIALDADCLNRIEDIRRRLFCLSCEIDTNEIGVKTILDRIKSLAKEVADLEKEVSYNQLLDFYDAFI